GRDDEAWSADTALQGGAFQESPLDGVQLAALCDPLDGGYGGSFGLHGKHQAGGHDSIVHDDRAGAAIAVVATLLGAGKAEDIAQALQQALPRLAKELPRFAVDGGSNLNLVVHGYRAASRAFSMAASSARRVSTPHRCRRYSAVPRMSVMGRAAWRAKSAASAKDAALT